jgi:hypothetical protein
MIELENSADVPTAGGHRERRLRIAAVLIIVGLAIELVSLRWAHPTAFIVFAAGTGSCVGMGVLVFLSVLLGTGPKVQVVRETARDKLPT